MPRLPQLAYIALAPFTGPEEAVRVIEQPERAKPGGRAAAGRRLSAVRARARSAKEHLARSAGGLGAATAQWGGCAEARRLTLAELPPAARFGARV